MRAPNISRGKELFLQRIVLDAAHKVSEVPIIFRYFNAKWIFKVNWNLIDTTELMRKIVGQKIS